jgi:putative redox protein
VTPKPAEESFAHAPIEVRWTGGQRFSAGRSDGPKVDIDGDGQAAASPVDLLLAAIASCAATDVVIILEKQRTPARSLEVRVESTRLNSQPRRLASVVLKFIIRGAGITPEKAKRAIDLSIEKYCSVRSSLRVDVPVTTAFDLGE